MLYHDMCIDELAVLVLGLVHMSKLYYEMGIPDDLTIESLNNAALVLAERIAVGDY